MSKTVHLVSILDRSGSMGGSETEVINAYNAFIADHKKIAKKEGATFKVTLVLFDHQVETLYKKVPIDNVKTLTASDYTIRGMTSLNDAVGSTIRAFNDKKRVIFFIETDGMENSSKEYSANTVKDLVKDKTKAGWDFNFVGADLTKQAADLLGGSIGINKTMVMAKSAAGYSSRNATFSEATLAYIKN